MTDVSTISVLVEKGAVLLVDVEISEPIDDLCPGGPFERARILVRLHGRPIGTVTVPLQVIILSAPLVAQTIWDELAPAIRRHCRADGFGEPRALTAAGLGLSREPPCSWRAAFRTTPPPAATVVVTTCGSSERLNRTIRGVLAQTYPRFDVVVVDNRPRTSRVRQTLEAAFPGDTRLRYVAEERQGLSCARNRGAAEAGSPVVAFTDDDVDVDPEWLGNLMAGFEGDDIACVTGLILPLELETAAQRLLEEFGGYSKGFERRTWDNRANRLHHPLYPYTVGAFGSGANAAFRVAALAEIGGFDESLGAGTPARGGEDIDIYVTCIERGYRIAYEPAAIVRHAHQRGMDEIHQKLHDYGVGLGAMLTKHLVRDWSTFAAMLVRAPWGLGHLLSRSSSKNAGRSADFPSSLARAELAGVLHGPAAYRRSRAAR